jgi:toxin ParE1/3/4
VTQPALVAPAARRDLREAVAWIARDNPAAARRLRDAAISAAHRIGANPQVGAPRPRITDPRFRFLILPGFPHVAIYAADRTPPRIVRVLHMARDLPALLAGIAP